jgi:hypothetical protein
MQNNQNKERNLRSAKILQAFFLISTAVYFGVLLFLRREITLSVTIDRPTLNLITVILAIIGIITAAAGIKLPRRILKRAKTFGIADQTLLTVVVIQSSLFEAIAIYGLVLGIIGARLEIAVLFMVVSAGLFIFTFPGEDKIKKWLE